MKKLKGLITVFTMLGTLSTFAQSDNLQSTHNYKRPVSKSSAKRTQTMGYVIERSTGNFVGNSLRNYKIPQTSNSNTLNLVAIGTSTGIGLSHFNYKQPINFRNNSNKKLELSTLKDISELNGKDNLTEIRIDSI